MRYIAKRNTIVDETGLQIAVVLPSNCSKKAAHEMAAYAAQQMNHKQAQKERAALRDKPANDV